MAATCEKLYTQLQNENIEVLFDDRNVRPGIMFADHELIGIPHRIVVSDRGIKAGTVEYKARALDEIRHIDLAQIETFLLDALSHLHE